jgi:hypothetical protein
MSPKKYGKDYQNLPDTHKDYFDVLLSISSHGGDSGL